LWAWKPGIAWIRCHTTTEMMQRDSALTVVTGLGPGESGRRRGNRVRLGSDFRTLRYQLFLPFLFLGRRSTDPHRRRHEMFNHTDHKQWVVRMRYDARIIAEEVVDQCALARVQEWTSVRADRKPANLIAQSPLSEGGSVQAEGGERADWESSKSQTR
jgi:hypothetical protein